MKSLHVKRLPWDNTGLADNYYRPEDSELLSNYSKAMPGVTILERRPDIAKQVDLEGVKKTVQQLLSEFQEH